MTNLVINSQAISQHNDFYSLNDLHRVSGGESKYQPAFFLRNQETQEMIAELEKENTVAYHTVIGKGKKQGTYACRELVIRYGMWISPKFSLMVIRAFDALNTGNIPCLAQVIIADNQAYQIQKAVKAKCLHNRLHYQTLYRRLYDEFGIKSYKDILACDFERALAFIESFVFVSNPSLIHNILADQAHQTKKAKGELNEIIGVVKQLIDHIDELQQRLDISERNIVALRTRFIV